MTGLKVRNVHEALPRAIQLLNEIGVRRESRNGPVLFGGMVATIYEKPQERVLFWPQRDANPFFHLYESLWMLAGRNDVEPLTRYVKQAAAYSDDGVTSHGAYGHRWRHSSISDKDQLRVIAQRLKEDPTDRRSVLQMWDSERDLWTNEEAQYVMPKIGKDFPCNTMATFQRGVEGELNLVVFCRSNDIVWGAYGANAVQFSTLLEYMAHWIGCPMGTYTQISVNWHGYLDTLKQVEGVLPDDKWHVYNPYEFGHVRPIRMAQDGTHERVDELIHILLEDVDAGFPDAGSTGPDPVDEPWAYSVYAVLKAHHFYKTYEGEERFAAAFEILSTADQTSDWVVAAREWFLRRELKAESQTRA